MRRIQKEEEEEEEGERTEVGLAEVVVEEVEEEVEEDSQNTSCHNTPALLPPTNSIKDAKHYKLIYKVCSNRMSGDGCHNIVILKYLFM